MLCLLLLAACAKPQPEGKVLMQAAGCFSCHKVGAFGGNSGPDLSFVGLRQSPQWLDKWIEHPSAWKADALMPDLRLSVEKRAVIVDYLSGLRGQDHPPGARPWDKAADPVEKGRVLYAKAGCAACHGAAGRGGQPNNNVPGGAIAALETIVTTYSEEELARRIRYGTRATKQDPAGPEPAVAMPAWGQVLDAAEISAVSAYLRSIAKAGPEGW